MNRRVALLSGVAALAVVGIGGYYLVGGPSGTPQVDPAAPAGDVDTSRVLEMELGDPDAPVTVVEYASFTCPHCATFHQGVFKELKANYIDTGKVRFIYREVFFDRFGLWAAMVARCGGPERYFGIADLIYRQQRDWTAGNDPAVIAANLGRIGRTAGLSEEQITACMQDGEMAEALVAVYQQNAERDGISSTPSFLINGERHGNMSYADFARLIDEELSG